MNEDDRIAVSRRHLLAAGAGVSAALWVGQAIGQEAEGQPLMGNPDLPEPMEKRMRWAVVGLGSFAVGQVMPGFVDANLSRMTAFISGNRAKAEMLGQRYGVDRFYSYDDYDRIAQDDEIDCVYVALPVGLHAEYTIRALDAGKHVLCEKPMASTSAECEAMIAAARRNDRRLGVAYRIHFEPTNRNAFDMIAGDALGPLRHIRCDHGFDATPESWPPHRWRLEKALAGGGSMYDIGIYGLNTAQMMLPDDRPVSVAGVYAYPKDDPRFAEVEGGVEWRMAMASGAVVSGSSSYCYQPYVSRQAYLGARGAITMDPATTYYENELVLRAGNGRRAIESGPPARQFADQVDGFTRAVREGRAHRTPGEMGLRDIRLIEAIYRSAENGGASVAV
ncbi:Gfo/Idh/MocA family oxidoreductase [Erythrobacter sp. LQ02-29]|uniref:Gfo/Idh/MocA family protein n=1 Tax=Erythrobacter sp. LQ02-29 TaxID=2920384 RepID=UPI001F4E4ED8|nr:Gfo/Idh/MocA family oxidoreductase [Erythrobacter sp. LQ02-29]MCP9221197.1 Gfo/Idh/MocA family oxidoreductase [Erythrobacter sp. LQ02-29]